MPNRNCSVKDCTEIVSVKTGQVPFCSNHLDNLNSKRKRYPRNYYGSNWNAIRTKQLRNSPYCTCRDLDCLCSGTHGLSQVVMATDVDHIARFRDWSNKNSAHKWLQSLCKSCHSSKTMRTEVRGNV